MAKNRSPKHVEAVAEPTTKPVRIDLRPDVHKALRKAAAEAEMSMTSLARKIVTEHLGFKSKD